MISVHVAKRRKYCFVMLCQNIRVALSYLEICNPSVRSAAVNLETLERTDGPLDDINDIPIIYTDSDEETDALKKKISFLELEQILKGECFLC